MPERYALRSSAVLRRPLCADRVTIQHLAVDADRFPAWEAPTTAGAAAEGVMS